jgi:hypothetical protein
MTLHHLGKQQRGMAYSQGSNSRQPSSIFSEIRVSSDDEGRALKAINREDERASGIRDYERWAARLLVGLISVVSEMSSALQPEIGDALGQ